MATKTLPGQTARKAAIRCAIYLRISKDDEGKALGVARQREDCVAHALKRGFWFEEDDIYDENDMSASTNSKKPRPKFNAMIQGVRDGKYQAIVSYSNSRLTRRPLELENLIQLHEQTRVFLSTIVSGQYDLSTADGRMQARILAAVDAAEAERVSERTKRAMQDRRNAGLPTAGRRRFGYLLAGQGDALVVNEGFREVIRSAYERWIAGDSFRALALEWNAIGIRTESGLTWNDRRMQAMMETGFAAGLIREHSTPTNNTNLASYDVWRPGIHEAIIDSATWKRFYDKRIANNSIHPRRVGSPHTFSGLLACGLCPDGVVFFSAANTRGRRSWRCPRWVAGKAHRHIMIMDDFVEAAVLDWIERNAIGGDDVDLRAARIAEAQQVKSELSKIQADLAYAISRLVELDRKVDNDEISAIGAKVLRTEREAEIARLERAEAIMEARIEPPATPEAFTTLRQEWGRYSPAAKRDALKAVLNYIVVHPARRKGGRATLKFHAK